MEATRSISLNQPLLSHELVAASSDPVRVESQLSRLPSIPAGLPGQPTAEASVASSLDQSDSSITTTLDSTPTFSTAATSVLASYDTVKIQDVYVCPGMSVDASLQHVWSKDIHNRLHMELVHHIHDGSWVQEFMPIGKTRDKLQAGIVITCREKRTKKEVEKLYKKLKWLKSILKIHHILFVALVQSVSLSGTMESSRIMDGAFITGVEIVLESDATTFCGQIIQLSIDGEQCSQCTLGGMIIVNGDTYALTAGHPFRVQEAGRVSGNEVAGTAEHLGEVDEGEDDSDSAFIADENDTESDSTSMSSASSFVHDVGLHRRSSPILTQTQIRKGTHFKLELAHMSTSVLRLTKMLRPTSDWALLKSDTRMPVLPNLVACGDHQMIVVGPFLEDETAAAAIVIMIAGIGPQRGTLHPTPASLNIDNLSLDVRLVTLEHTLPLGTSGAWVFSNNRLLGHIVATRQDVPWAYMQSFSTIIDDIKKTLGTDNVHLPSIVNTRGTHHPGFAQFPVDQSPISQPESPSDLQQAPSRGNSMDLLIPEVPEAVFSRPRALTPRPPGTERDYLSLEARSPENSRFAIARTSTERGWRYLRWMFQRIFEFLCLLSVSSWLILANATRLLYFSDKWVLRDQVWWFVRFLLPLYPSGVVLSIMPNSLHPPVEDWRLAALANLTILESLAKQVRNSTIPDSSALKDALNGTFHRSIPGVGLVLLPSGGLGVSLLAVKLVILAALIAALPSLMMVFLALVPYVQRRKALHNKKPLPNNDPHSNESTRLYLGNYRPSPSEAPSALSYGSGGSSNEETIYGIDWNPR